MSTQSIIAPVKIWLAKMKLILLNRRERRLPDHEKHSFFFMRDLRGYIGVCYIIQKMDRFELRESTVRRSNMFTGPETGRSFISTAMTRESVSYGDDLRKSRIQNLPNYKKANLGESINFVVVFQTIEIERLSNEVEVLRVKLKEAQRQLFNAANYEVQIRELTEKLYSYERDMEAYTEEIEKLNQICQTLYHDNENLKTQLNEIDFSLKQKYESERQKNQELLQEIEKWRARYQAGEKSKAKELEELRNMMESQRKSMIDREIREMAIRFQNERAGLESEIRKLREMVSNRENQIQNYKERCQHFQIENMELRNHQNTIEQLENQLASISSQIMRLTELMKARDDEIQNFKKREYDLNIKLKAQAEWQNDNRSLREQLDHRIKEINDWRSRASRLEQEAVRGKEMALYKQELEGKLELTAGEVERLSDLMRNKMDEIEGWKQRFSAKEAELTHYKNLENDMATYENKLNMLKAENDRINGILKSRLEQIEAWKRKNNELQDGLSRMTLLEKDKKMFEDKFNNQIKNIQELNFAIEQMRNENDGLRRAETRCRDVENKSEIMAKEMERLNNLLRGKEQEVNDSRIKLSKLETNINEFRNIQLQLNEYENKIALMTQEIDRLNNLIKDRNQDISTLENQKLQLHTLVNQYKNYELKIQENEQTVSKLQSALNNARNELDGMANKIRIAESKAKEAQNQLYSQSMEKEKVGSMAREKTKECDDLRNKLNNTQNELRRMAELQNICEQLKNQSVAYVNDLQNAERRNRELDSLLGREKSANQDLKSKLTMTAGELERMTNEIRNNDGKRSRQFSELQENFSRLLSKVKSKDNEIEMLVSKVTQLEGQCQQLLKEFNRLLEAVENSYKETAVLAERIEEYQDYARRISILGSELDRLSQFNKGLEEDNKTMRLKYSNSINFERKEQELQLMSVLMAVEIESLRGRIDQREVNLQEMRKSILDPIRRI